MRVVLLVALITVLFFASIIGLIAMSSSPPPNVCDFLPVGTFSYEGGGGYIVVIDGSKNEELGRTTWVFYDDGLDGILDACILNAENKERVIVCPRDLPLSEQEYAVFQRVREQHQQFKQQLMEPK